MNARITRLTLTAVLAVTAAVAATTASQTEAQAASPESHPDFAWWPTGKMQGTRLFVGNLSMTDGSADAAVQYNPKEITVEQSVPWK